MEDRSYHHGNLRAAVMSAALEVIAESGPGALSLRDLARRAGVSHAAPAHHFGDKTGLLTAVAVDGFTMLAAELSGTREETSSLVELGVAYVRFATGHRAHFEVMFRPDLLDGNDESLRAAGDSAARELLGGVSATADRRPLAAQPYAGVAAWSIVHGLATLWLSGNLAGDLAGGDPEVAAREVAGLLFPED